MKITVLTPIPSPYQIELFDALAGSGLVQPRVVYLSRTSPGRNWLPSDLSHDHLFLSENQERVAKATEWVKSNDLFVASWYSDTFARFLIATRATSGRPWCYWGERPGFAHMGWLGRLRRRWWLSHLRRSIAPVWGVGSWAVDGWRQEFGERRLYQNVPYFSELKRFSPPNYERPDAGAGVRFLFSGALTKRKGVDLLAAAFARIAASRPHISLEFVGTGELGPALRSILRGLGDRVSFTGFVQWAELPQAYHRADVLVAPSRYDGWGLVVPEGLAAGLPVISTDRTGAAIDLIEPGLNGWRVTAGDGESLTRAMAEAADLPAGNLREMSARARMSVANHSLMCGVDRFATAASTAINEWRG